MSECDAGLLAWCAVEEETMGVYVLVFLGVAALAEILFQHMDEETV